MFDRRLGNHAAAFISMLPSLLSRYDANTAIADMPECMRFWSDLIGRGFMCRKSGHQHHLSRAKYSPSRLVVGQVLR